MFNDSSHPGASSQFCAPHLYIPDGSPAISASLLDPMLRQLLVCHSEDAHPEKRGICIMLINLVKRTANELTETEPPELLEVMAHGVFRVGGI